MELKCTITQKKKGVEIFQLANGKYWPMKYTNYNTKKATNRNSLDFSNIANAISHATKFINQRPRAQKN